MPTSQALMHPGTNIFPVYADPEMKETWQKYHLESAALVIWCSIDRAPDRMCDYFADKKVPFITISNSNQEAKTLYEARCTYVVQQEYLAAKEFSLMLQVRRRSWLRSGFRVSFESRLCLSAYA